MKPPENTIRDFFGFVSKMTIFNLNSEDEYDWVSVQGLPALKEKKPDEIN
jgi:hypothetical protein